MILRFIIRHLYLVFVPFLAQSFYNPRNFPSGERDRGVLCYVQEVTYGISLDLLRMGAGFRENQPCDWRLELSVPPVSPGSGGGAGDWVVANGQGFSQSWLCNEVSIKTQKDGVRELQGWWTRGGVEREVSSEHGSSTPLPMPRPVSLFHLAAPELYPFIINQWSRS